MASKASLEHEAGPSNGSEKRLLEAALSLFSRKGYDGASVREIIEEAGVTRPVLYYHFKNKEDLFRQLVFAHLSEMVDEFSAVLDQVAGCKARLERLICCVFERAERNVDALRLLVSVIFSPIGQSANMSSEPLLQERFWRVVQIMRDGLEHGELTGEDPEALALAFNALMDFHVMAKSRFPNITLTPELGEALVDLFLQGAGPGGAGRVPLVRPYEDDLQGEFDGAK